jgi:hypothetical protein
MTIPTLEEIFLNKNRKENQMGIIIFCCGVFAFFLFIIYLAMFLEVIGFTK